MSPEWLIGGATLFSAFAAGAAAVAAWYSGRVAAQSHELHRWAIHGASVHASVSWAYDGYEFTLLAHNDGPGVAYGVRCEVAPGSLGFDGVLPKLESGPNDRYDLPPAAECGFSGEWRQHSEKWLRVGLHWIERADDGAERKRERWIDLKRPTPPASGPATEH